MIDTNVPADAVQAPSWQTTDNVAADSGIGHPACSEYWSAWRCPQDRCTWRKFVDSYAPGRGMLVMMDDGDDDTNVERARR